MIYAMIESALSAFAAWPHIETHTGFGFRFVQSGGIFFRTKSVLKKSTDKTLHKVLIDNDCVVAVLTVTLL